MLRWFESSVNSEGIETGVVMTTNTIMFESSVNSEGIETRNFFSFLRILFESSVNSEGIETDLAEKFGLDSLRAV